MHSLSRSLENTRQNEHALQKANEDLQHYTAILEQRTRQLLTGAKVSRAASTILEPDELCQQVVDMVGERFGLYYVGLFLVDEKGEWAKVEHKLTLTLAKHAQLPYALADEKMTGQVFSAILTNALNYTPAGGSITVSTLVEENQGRMWTGFAISDTGPGIPVEDQERLFERFYRGRTGRASASPGTGLGLAIAKEIIYRHGGRIEVRSEGIPGKGTTFFVWLPVAA